ncbi:MAG: hypothetical protein IT312_08665 [Anaerolineales bacterium]|nr:hypothetical protein [Anaerolineales bacterium]
MARLRGPLLSLEAKGRVGKLLVYYGKNHARGWSTQNDPKTAAQLKSRAVVRGVMSMYKICAGLDRALLRKSFSKTWHTKITAWLTRNGLQNAHDLHDEWSAMPQAGRDAWELIVP